MTRISRDELEYCRKHRLCFDCHSLGESKPAEEFQRRGKFKVPCCRPHFNAARRKTTQPNARKYARRSEVRRKAGQCVSCHHKLIPQELLPPRSRERTCGMHVAETLRLNRVTLLRLITQYRLTKEEREEMTAQNIIYRRGGGLVWFSAQKPGVYLTKIFAASDLLQLYKKVRYAKFA